MDILLSYFTFLLAIKLTIFSEGLLIILIFFLYAKLIHVLCLVFIRSIFLIVAKKKKPLCIQDKHLYYMLEVFYFSLSLALDTKIICL